MTLEKKSVKHAMHYEESGNPAPSKGSARRYVEKQMDDVQIGWHIWYLIKRCKFAISLLINLWFVYSAFHRFIG